jgi:isopenicillin-N N-acyltransferase like protein
MFAKTSKMEWDRVREVAMTFEPVLKQKWPEYLEEMRGIDRG